MARSYLPILVACLFVQGVHSQDISSAPSDPPPVPSKALAVKLLALSEDRLEKDYTIGVILPGRTTVGGVEIETAARLVYFGPTLEEGRKSQRLCEKTLLWNEENGWFFYAKGTHLGRTVLLIWSEKRGEVEVR